LERILNEDDFINCGNVVSFCESLRRGYYPTEAVVSLFRDQLEKAAFDGIF
jgi:hypothetical protein